MMNAHRISAATPQAVDPIPDPAPKGIRPISVSTGGTGLIPVAIYARVSSDRQDINNSIQAQIAECTKYANEHGMIVVAIYIDEAASGTTSARPGFQNIMGDATGKAPKFKDILVWKLSRFSRDVLDSLTYQALLEKRGIKVISVTEPMDDSPAGVMIRGIIQILDAFYSNNLSQDVRRGLRKLVFRKFYPHNKVRYGLKLVKAKEEDDDASHYRIEPDPPYDQIARRIILEAGTGRTNQDIREGLFQDGIPSPRNKEKWPASTLDTMITDKTYAGYIIWKKSSKDPDERLEIPDAHAGVVTLEEWEQAQRSRASRSRSESHPREAGSERMMSGILKCRKCKKNLQVRPRMNPDICDYICKTRRHETVSVCDCPNLNSSQFEPLFLRAVMDDILSPSNMEATMKVIARELNIPYEELRSRLDLIDKEILRLEKKQERIMTAYEAGVYTPEECAKRLEPLRKQKADLEEKKAQANREMDRDAAIVANPQVVIDLAKDMRKLIRHSPSKETKELIKRFIKCVWIEPGRATIEYRIPMPNDGPNQGSTRRELALQGGEPVSVWPTARQGRPRGDEPEISLAVMAVTMQTPRERG